MLSRISYATLVNYSPRGQSDLSKKSRRFCGAVKAGNIQILDAIAERLNNPQCQHLSDFFQNETTLVPVPRSSPIKEGALWPAREICEKLQASGLAKDVLPCLHRTVAIPKSSAATGADRRPSVQQQYDTIEITCQDELFAPPRITLVDDVLTLGRTSFACAMRIHEAFPDADIRLFAVVRTKGFDPELNRFLDPEIGEISFNSTSGKTTRAP